MQIMQIFRRRGGSHTRERRNKNLECFSDNCKSSALGEQLFEFSTAFGKRNESHSERGLTKDIG
jgi:hypothetical protein